MTLTLHDRLLGRNKKREGVACDTPSFLFLSHAARYSERSSDSGQDAAGSQVCPFQRISGKLHADKGGCLITYYLFHTLYIYK